MAGKYYKIILQWVLLGPVLCIAIFTSGAAMIPAVFCFETLQSLLKECAPWLYYVGMGFTVMLCFFIYGISILFVAPFLNTILGARLKPLRGSQVSVSFIPWYVHSCLTLIVRYSFLEFITPTPMSQLYFRMMGMKIGRDVIINTTAISDPSLIEFGNRVTVGGTACLLAHYAHGGHMVLSPIVVHDGATIGLRAIIMGGVEIGPKAKILAGSFVMPNTKIPAGETWGGIPATRFTRSKKKKDQPDKAELKAENESLEVAESKEENKPKAEDSNNADNLVNTAAQEIPAKLETGESTPEATDSKTEPQS
ncbi:MAG: hypothetical protein P1V97_00740 [Planctomycetota bacterium]|nr:hypothetical protein [Planctomycetota bacterium]